MLKLSTTDSSNLIISAKNSTQLIANSSNIPQDVNNTSVLFNGEVLEVISRTTGCNGIRFYPGLEEGRLVMVAVPASSQYEDLDEAPHFCAVAYHESHSGNSKIISVKEASEMKRGITENGIEQANQATLRSIISVPGYNQRLKVYFPNTYLSTFMSPNNDLNFDIIEFTFSDTITLKSIVHNTNQGVISSLLPCPPYCGGGGGGGGTYEQFF